MPGSLLFALLCLPHRGAGNRRAGSDGPAQDRWRHGWRHRAPRGEGALLAKHCFASARTPSRQRLGRTADRGLRRLPQPDPPRHPSVNQLLLLLLLLLLLWIVAGAGRSPAENPIQAGKCRSQDKQTPCCLRHSGPHSCAGDGPPPVVETPGALHVRCPHHRHFP